MKKYLYILYSYWKMSLMNYVEYRFNFLVGGVSELSWMLMYIIFINVMFLHVKTINGWNKYEMLMLTFQSGLIDGIFTFFIVPGLRRLPEMIRTGRLDYILIKPISVRFNISLSRIDLTQIKNIIICVIGIFYCVRKLSLSFFNKNTSIYYFNSKWSYNNLFCYVYFDDNFFLGYKNGYYYGDRCRAYKSWK